MVQIPQPFTFEGALDLVMETAISKGLMDPEETKCQVKLQCITEYDNFGKEAQGYFFPSLAMFHSCEHITGKVIQAPRRRGKDFILVIGIL
ncbi:carboxylic ester hydrolase [Colletotrichum asianum]|uniref:Carboxylic ester hydrolase n=1 Tax=Colletotrichum asianum TaxID=702518 RepID=A0A8H3VX91_9PEZI|nr:carboxylic ester hydrolase [Colletotrichum asianum]